MSAKVKANRSGIDLRNVQEVIDAESSAEWATMQNQQQYFTPGWLVEECNEHLHKFNHYTHITVLDPQCGKGSTLSVPSEYKHKYGFDIDNRLSLPDVKFIKGNCVKMMDLVDEIYPDLKWHVINANPPFGKRWKVGESKKITDSTKYTWEWNLRHGFCGYFMSNYKTIEKLGIHKHKAVYKYERKTEVWKDCNVEIGIVWWRNGVERDVTNHYRTDEIWDEIETIQREESRSRPWNIWMENGKMKTYLSTRARIKRKVSRQEILKLVKVNDATPLSLTPEKETRKLMQELIDCGMYKIEPSTKEAIESAIKEVKSVSAPIMPVTDFQAVAYADEEETLKCINPCGMEYTVGKTYELSTHTYAWVSKFTRDKVHWNEETGEKYNKTHSCTLSGKDRYIRIVDDKGFPRRFMAHPRTESDMEETTLWKAFEKPEIQTAKEKQPDEYAINLKKLKTLEIMGDFTYYPGQADYVARIGTKDYGLIAADTGVGKSLMALSLVGIKGPKRALIVAPQATIRKGSKLKEDEDSKASQWVEEIRKFAPDQPVFELFGWKDYERIRKHNKGQLPQGIYITYYQAMFQNGARETAPSTWDHDKLEAETGLKVPTVPEHGNEDTHWCETIGDEKHGIRCILHPCMATKIGHLFDMVCVDEVHKIQNLDSNVTQMLIRLDAKYRYGFTATPIPNVIMNIFPMMGWLAVSEWHKGDRRNAAWPYSREDLGRFENTFLSIERDNTQEQMNLSKNPDWRGKCVKTSPVISSPARLLKILTPTMAFIDKETCNPDLVDKKVVDIRVPMGKEQSKLYAHFMNRSNIPAKHPLVRARKQIAYLRGICTDPADFAYGGPNVKSNFNPKISAILELVKEITDKGEQVVIVNSRIGISDTIQMHLTDMGITSERIDSTVAPKRHSDKSNLFKDNKAQVMIMGIMCAVGHSYPACPNLIIGSLEYSYGSKHQAEGRVFRVNSEQDVTIYCILHKGTIEETMFDVVATKQDSATICLYGKRIPRDFKPVDLNEVLSNSIDAYREDDAKCESDCYNAFIEKYASNPK